jgi:hypothetical protein
MLSQVFVEVLVVALCRLILVVLYDHFWIVVVMSLLYCSQTTFSLLLIVSMLVKLVIIILRRAVFIMSPLALSYSWEFHCFIFERLIFYSRVLLSSNN